MNKRGFQVSWEFIIKILLILLGFAAIYWFFVRPFATKLMMA